MIPLDALRESLDRLHAEYGEAFLETDPLQFLHRYDDPADQEVVGLLSALFAYGRVSGIIANLHDLLGHLSGKPSAAVRDGTLPRWEARFSGFRYRFQCAEDLLGLLWVIRRILRRFGSLEAAFRACYLPGRQGPRPLYDALVRWVRLLRAELLDHPRWKESGLGRGLLHLLPDPSTGSACKRWNLYLRWMVRGPDGLDLGLWRTVSKHHLILPLDTHTARICRRLGLTSRRSPSWAMAEEITRVLRALDPEDPVRYDFSIARQGILERCKKNPDPLLCASCPLAGICHEETAP